MSAKQKKGSEYKMNTWLVHGSGRSVKWDFSHHVVPPLSCSVTYRLDSTARGAQGFSEYGQLIEDGGEPPIYIYERLDEPTRSLLEGNLARVEGGDACVTFASGMAAVSAALGFALKTGDEVITHPLIYGCTHSLFTNWYPRLGFKTRRIDLTDLEKLKSSISDSTRIIYFESPTNPNMQLIDISAIREICNAFNKKRSSERKILVVIDNTFASPFCQRPLEHGADIVVYSLTKSIGGFGTNVGGAVICPKEFHRGVLSYRKDFGGVLSAKSAWEIQVYGLPTLPVRMKRCQHSAIQVASYLESSPFVSAVRYPGLESFPQRDLARRQMRDFDGEFSPGNMIYFMLHESKIDSIKFIDDLAANAYCITLAVSLGHTKTLIEAPFSMTHSSYGKGDPMTQEKGIRLSVGLESPSDIISDIEKSFKRVGKKTIAE